MISHTKKMALMDAYVRAAHVEALTLQELCLVMYHDSALFWACRPDPEQRQAQANALCLDAMIATLAIEADIERREAGVRWR